MPDGHYLFLTREDPIYRAPTAQAVFRRNGS